jgi:hypothetical protein
MADSDVTITWWLWEAVIEDRGTRVVLEARTLETEHGTVHTPVGYFPESDSGAAVGGWWTNRIMIEAEDFARYRAQGAIKQLPTSPTAPPSG